MIQVCEKDSTIPLIMAGTGDVDKHSKNFYLVFRQKVQIKPVVVHS